MGRAKSTEHRGTGQKACRVLLVEDDFDDQLFGRKELKSSEHVQEVLCFSNGFELIEYIKKQAAQDDSSAPYTPTVIVLDLNMPYMNGFEILKQFKSEPYLSAIPIVVVSGATSHSNVSKALGLEASAFFRKPLSASDLHTFLKHGWPWPSKLHEA